MSMSIAFVKDFLLDYKNTELDKEMQTVTTIAFFPLTLEGNKFSFN